MAGGIVRTPSHMGYNGRNERWVIMWGELTSPPYMNSTKNGKNFCKITVGLTKEIKQTVSAWESSSPEIYALLTQLEKGDMVLVLGTQPDGTYQNSRGENAMYDIVAQVLIPQVAINAAIQMFLNPQIGEMLAASMNTFADGYADDYTQQNNAVSDEPEDDPYEDFSAIDEMADETPFR